MCLGGGDDLLLWETKEKRKGVGRVGGWDRDRRRNRQVNVQSFVKTTLDQTTLMQYSTSLSGDRSIPNIDHGMEIPIRVREDRFGLGISP